MENSGYTWASRLLSKPREKEFEHFQSGFERISHQSSDYIINPDWVSESMDKTTAFGSRRYRPWSYEFQGARYWPYGTMERRLNEESARRHLISSAPVPLALEPRMVMGEERNLLFSPVRLMSTPSKTPFRSKSFTHCPPRDEHIGRSEHVPHPYAMNNQPNRYEKAVTGTDLMFCRGPEIGDALANRSPYDNDMFQGQDPLTYSHHMQEPNEVRLYGGNFPIVRPERPPSRYTNFVNMEWIPHPTCVM